MTTTSRLPVEPAVAGTDTAALHIAARADRPESVSIIIPAHDEALALPGCLQCLANQDYAGLMQVIVVDNGSIDGTSDVARQWQTKFKAREHELVVLRLEKGNKPAALNAGDAAATGSCRIYLDADTETSPNCVSSIVAALGRASAVGLCCARMQVAPARSWVTRRYGRVWSRLPWVCDDVIGAGLYAVSAIGRRRWSEFPDVIADDMWAQAQFERHERQVIGDASFVVRLPEGFRNLVNVRTRWVRGNREVARRLNGDRARLAFPLPGRFVALLARPYLWPDLPLYFMINACALWQAKRRNDVGTGQWERGRPRKVDGPTSRSR